MPTGKGALRIAIEDFLDTFKFEDIFSKWIIKTSNKVETEIYGMLSSVASALGMELVYNDIIAKLYAEQKKHASPGFLMSAGFALLGLVGGVIAGATRPYARRFEHLSDASTKSFLPDLPTLAALKKAGLITDNTYIIAAAKNGVDTTWEPAIYDLLNKYPTIFESIALWRRGYLTDAELKSYASRERITEKQLTDFKNLTKLIPAPTDLVNMAVREAWNEETVTRFQYDADFPAEFSEWMIKQGYTDDWAKRFWRAHWQLPSLSAAYEMLHRLRPDTGSVTFNEADLETLLRTADIPTYFRERLKLISYSPYTRVDVRRMYAANVLTREDVKKAYLDLGYDDAHAENLTQFTTTIERAEEKGLTREAVTGTYKRGMISRTDAIASLKAIGYNDADAEYWLAIVDYDLEAQATEEKLAVIKSNFVNWQIDEVQLSSELAVLNLPSDRMQSLQSLWSVSRLNKAAAPSKSELENFYKLGFLTLEQISEYLKRDGYQPKDIELYVKRFDLEAQEAANKELERTAKEADRLAKLETASELSRARAVIDVNVAEARVQIADIKVALGQSLEPEAVKELKNAILELGSIIANLQLEKARLKAE